MASQHLLPEPERLTELYFTDHLKLPSTVARNSSLPISFTIHNIEYQPMSYTYQILEVPDSKKEEPANPDDNGENNSMTAIPPVTETLQPTNNIRKQGVVHLNHDETKQLTETVDIGDIPGRMKIEILLVEKEQPIHFWITVN